MIGVRSQETSIKLLCLDLADGRLNALDKGMVPKRKHQMSFPNQQEILERITDNEDHFVERKPEKTGTILDMKKNGNSIIVSGMKGWSQEYNETLRVGKVLAEIISCDVHRVFLRDIVSLKNFTLRLSGVDFDYDNSEWKDVLVVTDSRGQ